MAEETAEQIIENWKTGAFFLLLCVLAAWLSSIFLGLLLGPIWGLLGFLLGGVVMFLLISRKLYG